MSRFLRPGTFWDSFCLLAGALIVVACAYSFGGCTEDAVNVKPAIINTEEQVEATQESEAILYTEKSEGLLSPVVQTQRTDQSQDVSTNSSWVMGLAFIAGICRDLTMGAIAYLATRQVRLWLNCKKEKARLAARRAPRKKK